MTENPLHGALHNPMTTQTRSHIINELWPNKKARPSPPDNQNWDAYFAYYTRECNAALVDEGKYVLVRTHLDLMKVAHIVESGFEESEVRQKLRKMLTQRRSVEDENRMLDGTIRLVTRLLVMVNTGAMPSEISGRACLTWTCRSLKDAVHAHFLTNSQADAHYKNDILPNDLTCRNIEQISGIKIVPTDNLVDHLRLIDHDSKLCLFYHATFLNRVKNSTNLILPKGLAEETLDTLALLLPDTNRKTKRWLLNDFSRHPFLAELDLGLLKCGHFRHGHPSRRLEHYHFWHDRLLILMEARNDATPSSRALFNLLKDRKKEDRWLNSWVALVAIGLTLFFGLVQSIEGAIQVYKAYH